MTYKLIRPFLFHLDPELAHHLTLNALKLWPVNRAIPTVKPTTLFGLNFPNPIGLAAGLDKNGDYIDALGSLGFGFIEIGTVTPKPQPGNAKPRLFRLPEHQAIINRMGFNNKGVDYLVSKVKQKKYQGILGINIGKNASTAIEDAQHDYVIGMQKVYAFADYITVNISSPNTLGLRTLQGPEYLQQLLSALKSEHLSLIDKYKKYVPLLIKIAPDLTDQELESMAEIFLQNKIDGIIATNTTLDRDQVQSSLNGQEAGGLSGAPLFKKSTQVLAKLRELVGSDLPIIASGGVLNANDANQKFASGANLVQLYTGLIYEGPKLILDLMKNLNQ